MKITHNKVGQNLNMVDGAKSGRADKADKSERADKSEKINKLGLPNIADAEGKAGARVELSPRAQEAKRIKELAMSGPDVDQVKVEKFRRLIDEGNYKVNADAVADRMVDEHLGTLGGE